MSTGRTYRKFQLWGTTWLRRRLQRARRDYTVPTPVAPCVAGLPIPLLTPLTARTMGKNKNKRKAGISGLARFVLESFNTDNAAASSSTETIQGSPAPPSAKKQKLDDETSKPILAEPAQDGGSMQSSSSPSLGPSSRSKTVATRKRYDASGIVPHYEEASAVPEHLQKCMSSKRLRYAPRITENRVDFSQRYRFFTLYSEPPGCLLDEEGWFSVTPERIANQIAERCRCDTILDGFCGVGGNAIAFAQTCNRGASDIQDRPPLHRSRILPVIALDVSPTRLALARHNAEIYGVADRIEFIQADYLSFIETEVLKSKPRKIDVIFLSPPWGGPSYLDGPVQDQTPVEGEHPPYHLSSIQPIHGAELFRRSRVVTSNIAYFLPRNTVLSELAELAGEEKVEVEEEWTGSKLKALTCYYGGLAEGQGHLF